MKIRQNDRVQIMRGKDLGKRANVQRMLPKNGRALVEGLNMVKRHLKASANIRQAGIVLKEAPIQIANLSLVCSHCDKPVKVGVTTLEDGRKVRVCRSCKEAID